MAEKIGPGVVLQKFFGYHLGTGAKEFAVELRALTAEEKLELAQGAARELGLTADQVSFPLS